MYFDFQWISLYIFVIVLTLLVIKNRKKIDIQRIIFPILYAGLYRTNFGIKFMKKISTKYREWIKFLGLCGIGFGFLGMIVMVYGLIYSVILVLTTPSTEGGMSLVLPQTNIPGIGFLPFWYWIIALFVIVLIHEFSHGIVAKANGVKIKSSGLGFFAVLLPIVPVAFVEPDEKELQKKDDHVKYSVFAAGPFSNILTAVIILFMFLLIFNPVNNLLTEENGISFEKINDSYPSSILPERFHMTSMNNVEINNFNDFITEINKVKPGDEVTLSSDEENYTLTTIENPDVEDSAFIGINNFKNEVSVKDNVNMVCFNIYKWFRDLLKWIGLLSFFIGLANLLPLGPVDGGQMLRTLLGKVIKDEERAKKKFVIISLFVFFLIVLSLVWPYFSKLF